MAFTMTPPAGMEGRRDMRTEREEREEKKRKKRKKEAGNGIKNKGLSQIKEDRKTGFFAHFQSFDFPPRPGGCLCEITFF